MDIDNNKYLHIDYCILQLVASRIETVHITICQIQLISVAPMENYFLTKFDQYLMRFGLSIIGT